MDHNSQTSGSEKSCNNSVEHLAPYILKAFKNMHIIWANNSLLETYSVETTMLMNIDIDQRISLMSICMVGNKQIMLYNKYVIHKNYAIEKYLSGNIYN